jgi:hypothetical protein
VKMALAYRTIDFTVPVVPLITLSLILTTHSILLPVG